MTTFRACSVCTSRSYEADLAKQRFMQVDPNNRLVADALEADWNQKLRALREAQETCEKGRQADRAVLDEYTDREVAARLNQQGLRSGKGGQFNWV